MMYLLDYEFNQQEINDFKAMNKMFLIEKLEEYKDLAEENIKYLKDLGVLNYKDIFKRHAEIFLMDVDAFAKMFEKYDREDLIEKLKTNPDIIEIL